MTPHSSVCVHTWKTQLWLSAKGTGADDPRVVRWLQDFLHAEVARLDAAANRFRPDSEISAVNTAAGRWVGVSWYFVAVLSAALRAARATGGLVDPTVGRSVRDQGYDTWAGHTTPPPAHPETPVTWRDVDIKPGRPQASVRIPPGAALDLGAVAKGWLADRMATTTHRRLGFDALANAGGDLRSVAVREPWTVEVDPGVPGRPARAMDLMDAGLATSGVAKRHWDGPDGPRHHIIDPRTRRSATTYWTSASVLAADAAAANAAATASIVRGEQARTWLQSQRLDAWLNAADRQALVGTWGRSQEVQPC